MDFRRYGTLPLCSNLVPCNEECTLWMRYRNLYWMHRGSARWSFHQKFEEYLAGIIESKLRQPLEKSFLEYQQKTKKIISLKRPKLEECKTQVAHLESRIEHLTERKSLIDKYIEVTKGQQYDKSASGKAILFKISKNDLLTDFCIFSQEYSSTSASTQTETSVIEINFCINSSDIRGTAAWG